MQSVREPGQGSLNLLPALVNLQLKNRSYHILLLVQSFGWTQAIKKVTTGWKQIKTPQIVPFGSEPVKCTLGSFSKTWGLLLSKKIPESENSHITVRLQGPWVRGKKNGIANLAINWGHLTTFILQEPRTLLSLDCFAYLCYERWPLQPMSSPSLSIQNITWLLLQVSNGGFLCQFIDRSLERQLFWAFGQQPALTESTLWRVS